MATDSLLGNNWKANDWLFEAENIWQRRNRAGLIGWCLNVEFFLFTRSKKKLFSCWYQRSRVFPRVVSAACKTFNVFSCLLDLTILIHAGTERAGALSGSDHTVWPTLYIQVSQEGTCLPLTTHSSVIRLLPPCDSSISRVARSRRERAVPPVVIDLSSSRANSQRR